MKKLSLLISIVLFQFTFSQSKIKSISPSVDQQDENNIKIINTLAKFLETQDPEFWLEADFKKNQITIL